MQNSEYINIVLASDANYTVHVETLLKSIFCYNRKVHIYLFHRFNFPIEWFNMINCHLSIFDSKIISAQVNIDKFETYKTLSHITSPAYYRFLMANIPVARALYLDSDTLVTSSLTDFFNIDLQGKSLAAVSDSGLLLINWQHPFNLHQFPYFNSGVLLTDLNYWRQENIEQQLLDTADKIAHDVPFGDQCVLNMVFQNNWLELSDYFNYQAGLHHENIFSFIKPPTQNPPLIVHFTSNSKPWNVSSHQSSNIFDYRWLYWRYRNLSWADVTSIANNITHFPIEP